LMGVPLISAFDGTHGWTQFGEWVAPASPTANELIRDEVEHGLPALVDIFQPASKIEMLPKEIELGKLCDVFRVTTSGGKSDTFFADPQTHLILRCDYNGVDQESGARMKQTIEYSDYRPVGRSLEPFRIVQSSGGQRRGETVVTAYEDEMSLDDKIFQMPPESEIPAVKQKSVAVPFDYDNNQIIVKARVNNGPEENFIVDTGASQTVIDSSAAMELGARSQSTFSVTAGSTAVPLGFTQVSTLSLGDITLDNLPVLITDLSTIPGHPSGLIGANVLKRFLVTLDFDEKKIVLADPRSATVPEEARTVATVPVFGGTAVMVKGMLDEKTPIGFLVDTGASFNNLPKSLAKPLYTGNVLPVGTIMGLDGHRLNIGSIKLNSLSLGSVVIPHPVFTVTPEATPASHGLFSATGLGILGNPIWSQFRTTIDYRNERLILESESSRDHLNKFLSQIEQADKDYLRSKNVEQALKSYEGIESGAKSAGLKAAEALALSRIARCHGDRFNDTRDGHYLDVAGHEYQHAIDLANESRNRTVEGQVLALWALTYLNSPRSDADIKAAQGLLQKALQKAPMDATIFAAFGTTLLHIGQTQEAEKLLDRALMLDPANWQALWSKYKLYADTNRSHDQLLVAAQLKHYYPTYPDVLALSKRP